MRRYLGIILVILLAIGILVAINSLAYVTEEPKHDSELLPNRSSYHGGPTGTRALHDFLNESGYHVMRWREAPERLLSDDAQQVKTLVIVGDTRVAIREDESEALLAWVTRGGRLVLVDRHPELEMLPAAGDWMVTTEFRNFPDLETDPANYEQMTKDVGPATPVLPSLLTDRVEAVLPSKFYAAIKFSPMTGVRGKKDSPPPRVREGEEGFRPAAPGPVVHLTIGNTPLLVDYAHGKGRIVVLSDPYIFSNGGIALRDNLQLAINVLAASDGIIAFDEFHQGRAITRNAFASYFAGTPILAICGQIALLVLLIVWTRGRRFARPVPLPAVDRRSSLEFVASMAELQHRAKAFDLAIENVYSRTRRVLARYAGLDYNSSRTEIAARVASRSTLEASHIEAVMRQSEEVINGREVSERQSVYLVSRLRELESALGLRMRSRDVKQSAQNI